jgi:hypothetical protein
MLPILLKVNAFPDKSIMGGIIVSFPAEQDSPISGRNSKDAIGRVGRSIRTHLKHTRLNLSSTINNRDMYFFTT